ncbi:MAG: glycogen synthase GlgA [Candidatus Nitrospinota bacterium M3_3B_026]
MAGPEKKRPLTIVMASSEAVPYSKTGGLADVAGALSRALAGLGHNVHLFTPLYGAVNRKSAGIPERGITVKVPISSREVRGRILSAAAGKVKVRFVENDNYYGRRGLYNAPEGDYPDNAERFVFFCRAVLEGIRRLKIRPDVIHVNDWQTSLIPVYMKTLYRDDPAVGRAASLLTIHNLGYQGVFWKLDWHLTGLPWRLFSPGGLEFHDRINFLKGGIVFSDVITTVSETYAKEIMTPELGWGLEETLKGRKEDLRGVLNGIDTKAWSPATDPLIPANYTASDLAGKEVCKKALLEEMGLPPGDEPLMACVSRLASQKGFDLLAPVIERMLDEGARFVLLGSGDRGLEDFFRSLAEARPGSMAVRIGYDEGLAHRIEAGADLFLMPSHYEPCGLNQMYSLAYGTAPVVRATGGLNDTVTDYDPATGKGNGFKFTERTPRALYEKTAFALRLFRENRGAWVKMVKRGMREDHSWSHSAGKYERLYRLALSRASGDK